MQKGDVYKTYASTSKLRLITNYKPKINIQKGVMKFIIWYKNFYKI